MKFNQPKAVLYIPDHTPFEDAMKRTTHMSIAAHHDDIEIMAYEGIAECFDKQDLWFFGVVVTNGSGSARTGDYGHFTDDMMMAVRKEEQIKAAKLGKYGALAMLDYPSSMIKDPDNEQIVDEIADLLRISQPDILYTHNLADKHDTHIGVTTKVIRAIRKLSKDIRPKKLYGCEVWRGLDWMMDSEKIVMDASKYPDLALSLVEVFDSQISGGKRYDKATLGRRLANATFFTSHKVDQSDQQIYAMELTPLIEDDQMDILEYVTGYIDRFKEDVKEKITRFMKQ